MGDDPVVIEGRGVDGVFECLREGELHAVLRQIVDLGLFLLSKHGQCGQQHNSCQQQGKDLLHKQSSFLYIKAWSL